MHWAFLKIHEVVPRGRFTIVNALFTDGEGGEERQELKFDHEPDEKEITETIDRVLVQRNTPLEVPPTVDDYKKKLDEVKAEVAEILRDDKKTADEKLAALAEVNEKTDEVK